MIEEEKSIAGVHELALIMREEQGILVKDGEQYVKAVFEAITSALSKKEFQGVHIKGYVKFLKKTLPARQGRNPKTGEMFEVEPHGTLSFRMGSTLKAAVR